MSPEILLSFVNTSLGLLPKIFLLILVFLYGIFAAVVARQVHLMNRVVNESNFSTTLFSITLIHLAAVIILFITALIIL